MTDNLEAAACACLIDKFWANLDREHTALYEELKFKGLLRCDEHGLIRATPRLAPLERPIIGLLIATKEMKDRIRLGAKTGTIRVGHRDYRVGETMLVGCHILDWANTAIVKGVRHTTFRLLSEEELATANYPDLTTALETMRRWYPRLDMGAKITFLRFQLIKHMATEDLDDLDETAPITPVEPPEPDEDDDLDEDLGERQGDACNIDDEDCEACQ